MELSFVSIFIVVLLVWFIWSQLKKSKTVQVFADSAQDMVELSAKWAHKSMIDSATIGNMDRAKEITSKYQELESEGVTAENLADINKKYGI